MGRWRCSGSTFKFHEQFSLLNSFTEKSTSERQTGKSRGCGMRLHQNLSNLCLVFHDSCTVMMMEASRLRKFTELTFWDVAEMWRWRTTTMMFYEFTLVKHWQYENLKILHRSSRRLKIQSWMIEIFESEPEALNNVIYHRISSNFEVNNSESFDQA